jgi:periplasmic protein TonB
VRRAGARSRLPWIYAVSLGAHIALGLFLYLLPARENQRVVAIDLASFKKKPPPPKAAPEPPEPPREHRPKILAPSPAAPAPAKVAEAPVAEPAPQPSAGGEAVADLGAVALDGAGAVNRGAGAGLRDGAHAASAPKPITHRIKQLAPAPQDECTEPIVKPKVKTPGQISYTKEGQEAEIEGVVRVQVTVDETGKVIAATVLSGLGYGLDERALAAARDSTFEPATLCGKPVVATKVLAFTFELR